MRNVWRLYGGWYDGTRRRSSRRPRPNWPASWPTWRAGRGAWPLAGELAASGDLRTAGHLAELAAQAAPDDAGVHRVRAEVFGRRAHEELSTMAKGVFSWARPSPRLAWREPGL